ncbi:MAG TPA: PqqD family protein [Bryobacteraceae bacterium]|jgi:hypothetical protein|nr:PqqD family protein [Bryobacteraceae bacterium]
MTSFPIDTRSIVVASSAIPFTRLDDEMLAIDEHAGFCYSMNASAVRVWELAANPRSVEDICAALCREFAVEPDTCAHDVVELLSAMRDAGFVKVTDAAIG